MRRTVMTLVLLMIASAAYGQSSLDVIGAWQWMQTEYADGTVVTPETLGHSIALQFSEDGGFRKYHNGVLVEDSTWFTFSMWVVEDDGGMVHVELVSTEAGEMWEPKVIFPNVIIELRNTMGGTGRYYYLGLVADEAVTWGDVKTMFRE